MLFISKPGLAFGNLQFKFEHFVLNLGFMIWRVSVLFILQFGLLLSQM